MNRFGCGIVALFLTLAAAFGLLVRQGENGAPRPMTPSQPPVRESIGALAIPVAGVRPRQLVDTYQDARGNRTHGALDIAAPRGTPVLAAAPGTVEKIFESEAGGHTVYVRGGGGEWVHYYAHLDGYAAGLREGMKVSRGQILGTVGSTGNASPEGPHLHFEVKRMRPGEKWYEGQGVNPYPMLVRR